MLRRSNRPVPESGFTLVELLIVISVVVILWGIFGEFLTNYLYIYLDLQTDGSNFTELAAQSQRIANVVRSATDLVSESPNALSLYAYFSPSDTYVSLVDYYLSTPGTAVMVSVTPMTANPPQGSPITAQTKTYTILTNYYQASGGSLFTYYDVNDDVLVPPIADEFAIDNIGINLAEPGTHTKTGQNLDLLVNLRNRKTSE